MEQVRIGVEAEATTAVELHRAGRHRACGLGRDHEREEQIGLGGTPRGLPHREPGALDRGGVVGEAMPDRLERADRNAELLTVGHVLDGQLERPRREPDQLRGGEHEPFGHGACVDARVGGRAHDRDAVGELAVRERQVGQVPDGPSRRHAAEIDELAVDRGEDVIGDRTRRHEPAHGFGHGEGEDAVGNGCAGAVERAPGRHVLDERDRSQGAAHRLGQEHRRHEIERSLAHPGDGIDRGPQIGIEAKGLRGAHPACGALGLEEVAQSRDELDLRG